jgi:hypothetical protein
VKPRDAVILGTILGVAFGSWNLLVSWRDPLTDDTPATLLLFYGPMFAAWCVAGFVATWRSGRLQNGIKAAAIVAFVTFSVFSLTNLLRVNMFLEAVRQRADWQNMGIRFQESGFESFRTFVNYNYVIGAPFKILVASTIGATVGFIGALSASLGRPASREMAR